jgi:hypothetical protein
MAAAMVLHFRGVRTSRLPKWNESTDIRNESSFPDRADLQDAEFGDESSLAN